MNTNNTDTPVCAVCKKKETEVRIYRPKGFYNNPDDHRCNAHVAENQHRYYIPCIIDTDGIVWEMSATPSEEGSRFLSLPEACSESKTWSVKDKWTSIAAAV